MSFGSHRSHIKYYSIRVNDFNELTSWANALSRCKNPYEIEKQNTKKKTIQDKSEKGRNYEQDHRFHAVEKVVGTQDMPVKWECKVLALNSLVLRIT